MSEGIPVHSHCCELGSLPPELNDLGVVKAEPMMFNANGTWARDHGGPITRHFLDLLTRRAGIELGQLVFDSRVHMLMPGWWPCIPGWHHDDVPRSTPDGQPNYDAPEYRSDHAAAVVGDPVSLTEFAVGDATFPRPPEGAIWYGEWDPIVEKRIEEGTLAREQAPLGEVIMFDDRTWHRGAQATGSGWRWFGRASWNTDRVGRATNEIRQQVQVYMSNPTGGW